MCKFGKTRLKSNLNKLCLVGLTFVATIFTFSGGPAQGANPTARAATLTVTVKNPRCPACLKTLKGYLLEMPEVKAVKMQNFADNGPAVKIAIFLNRTRSKDEAAGKVIDRIKARDMAVLSTRY